jgi:hypothetical protein
MEKGMATRWQAELRGGIPVNEAMHVTSYDLYDGVVSSNLFCFSSFSSSRCMHLRCYADATLYG